ncbi:MAG: hypothetical protein WD313_04465, partial [Acidimicrobiia bacterium]
VAEHRLQLPLSDADVERLAKAAMTVPEIELLSELEHELCVLDGSHQSPVIALNSALSSQSSEIRARTAALCGERDIAQKLRAICDHTEGARVIAMPKSDSSTELSAFVAERSRIPVTSSDRFLASQVLEAGEMTRPIKLPEGWEKLHIKAREGETDSFVIETAEALEEAIKPLREVRSEGRGVGVFYVMPESSSAAVRVEFKASNKKEAGPLIARAVSDETIGPFMQEPFPQHVADMMAKSIGAGLGAMTSAMTSQLSTSAEDYVEYLIRAHRTTGH